jgi:hypothetical protein
MVVVTSSTKRWREYPKKKVIKATTIYTNHKKFFLVIT